MPVAALSCGSQIGREERPEEVQHTGCWRLRWLKLQWLSSRHSFSQQPLSLQAAYQVGTRTSRDLCTRLEGQMPEITPGYTARPGGV